MKERIKTVLLSIGVIAGVLFPVLVPATTHAIDPFGGCSGNTQSKVCQAKNTDSVTKIIKSVVNILLYVVGAVSVIMIVVGGLRYVTSAGDSNGVSGAKDTIIYAVVGLVVASMAYAIVNFVLNNT